MSGNLSNLKIAIVCDWLTEVGGGEKVLLKLHQMFPRAPIYTSQFCAKSAPKEFCRADVRTGWLNIFPRSFRKFISPFRYLYFSHLNLREYDLIISVNNAEAKNISRKNMKKKAIHFSYLQGPPTQYYWGLYDDYIKNPGFGKLNFLARFGLKILVKPLRKVDFNAAQKPDFLIANSTYVAHEIEKYYKRSADIISPNVDVENIIKLTKNISQKDCKKLRQELFNGEEFFIITGRQVSWKRVDLAVQACAKTQRNLLIVGYGAEHDNLVKLANGNPRTKFLPRYDGASEIVKYFAAAKAFIFPSLEPFGITPIEALTAGCPLVSLKKGGALDFVIEDKNGVFFAKQNVENLTAAIKKIDKIKFDKKIIQNSAKQFSEANFENNFRAILTKRMTEINEK